MVVGVGLEESGVSFVLVNLLFQCSSRLGTILGMGLEVGYRVNNSERV